jgi:hypothetical protein
MFNFSILQTRQVIILYSEVCSYENIKWRQLRAHSNSSLFGRQMGEQAEVVP